MNRDDEVGSGFGIEEGGIRAMRGSGGCGIRASRGARSGGGMRLGRAIGRGASRLGDALPIVDGIQQLGHGRFVAVDAHAPAEELVGA